MSITIYAESIEELIDLKIDQRVLGEYKDAVIKLANIYLKKDFSLDFE